MHIKTASNGKKVVMSQKEWLQIGKKAGWMLDVEGRDPEMMEQFESESKENDPMTKIEERLDAAQLYLESQPVPVTDRRMLRLLTSFFSAFSLGDTIVRPQGDKYVVKFELPNDGYVEFTIEMILAIIDASSYLELFEPTRTDPNPVAGEPVRCEMIIGRMK